jgi:hypothetical protein
MVSLSAEMGTAFERRDDRLVLEIGRGRAS